MRRDRILQSAVAAALSVVPGMLYGGANPTLKSELHLDSGILDPTINSFENGTAFPQAMPGVPTSATWVSGFFTVTNQTTVAGSWNNALNWSPAVVPDGGGTATFSGIGDRVGSVVYMDINPTLTGINWSTPTVDRMLSRPTSIGGTTATVNVAAGTTLNFNASQNTWPIGPSFRGTQGLTGVQMFDANFGGGATSTVDKTGIGSINLNHNASAIGTFNIKGGNVFLWDHLAVAGSPSTNTNSDASLVSGTGVINIDGGSIFEWDVAAVPDNLVFNRPIFVGPNGANIRPVTDIPIFNNVISGTGTVTLGAFGDVSYRAANTYTGLTIVDSGLFLHFDADGGSALNTNFQNRARIDFDAELETTDHDRIGNDKSITMVGSGIQVNAVSAGFDFTEKWGTTNVASGVNHFTVYPSVSNAATLTMDDLNFTDGGVMFIRAGGLGGSGAFTSKIIVNNGVSLTGGGGSDGTTTVSISPNVYGFNAVSLGEIDSGGQQLAGLMTYQTGVGFRALDTTTEYVSTIGGSTNAADNVRVTGAEAVGAAKTINGLVLHGTAGNYTVSGSPVTVSSGLIVSAVDSTQTATVSNNISFGATRGTVVSVGTGSNSPSGTLALTGVISNTGPAGVLFNGGGNVVLGTANTYDGVTTISAARVLISADVKADGVTPGPLGLATSPIRLLTSNDGATDPGSNRWGTQASMLMNSSAGLVTIDRDINVVGEVDFLAGSTAVVGGTTTTSQLRFTGEVDIANDSMLQVQSGGTVTFDGVISGGGSLRTVDTGTVVLNQANTYSGGTEFQVVANTAISPANTRQHFLLGNDDAFGAGPLWIVSNATGRKPTFVATGGARIIDNDINGQGGFDVGGSNPITFTGNIDLVGGNTSTGQMAYIITNTATTTFAGNLSRGGFIKAVNSLGAINDTGNGTLVFTGDNSGLDGPVLLGQTATGVPFSTGVLQITNSTGLGTGGMINNNTTILPKSTLELNATGPAINLSDFMTIGGTGSASLGAIHNKAGHNTSTGNINLARAGTETVQNTSILVEPGTSLTVGTNSGNFAAYGSLQDVSGQVTAASSTAFQAESLWTPATRTAGTATFSKTGGGTLTVARISNLRITTQVAAPGADGSNVWRDQFINRVPFETLNVSAGTMAISLGRNISNSDIVQGTRSPLAAAGSNEGFKFLVTPSQNKTTFVKNLNITAGATLDLNDNDLIVDYTGASPFATIQAQIKSAYVVGTGDWTGTGITSAAARIPANAGTALGYVEASDIGGPTSYSGVNGIDAATAVIVRYTWGGDANVDGVVDTVDFNLLAANFPAGVGDWFDGDFNYDSLVDTIDVNILAANFPKAAILGDGARGLGGEMGGVGALVPEPTSAALLGLAASGLLARRRRNA